MAITRAQVADLQPGDTVEYHGHDWPEGHTVIGPLYERFGALWLAGDLIRFADGDVTAGNLVEGTLAVISRRRPLYVNHSRTWAIKGDVARSAERDDPYLVWGYDGTRWYLVDTRTLTQPDFKPGPLRLLVDGETGQAAR